MVSKSIMLSINDFLLLSLAHAFAVLVFIVYRLYKKSSYYYILLLLLDFSIESF